MAAKLTVYTVITNNYDNLRPPATCIQNAQLVCFTDRPRHCQPWQIQPIPYVPWLQEDWKKTSRIPKTLPHLLLDSDVGVSIYMDGAFRLQADPQQFVEQHLGDNDIAVYQHPCRNSYLEERQFYQDLHKFVPEDVNDQVEAFIAEGLPINGQFYCGGLICRRHNEATAKMNEIWAQGYFNGSSNDQLALYRAIVLSGVKVGLIQGDILSDKTFGYCLHASAMCNDNADFAEENDFWNSRRRKILKACARRK